MKYFILFIYSTFLFSDNASIKFFVGEHNYDGYKLEKKLIFHKEILDNNFTKYNHYVKVYYSGKDKKIIKYENYNKIGNKISTTLFDEKGRILKTVGSNGTSSEYFYAENMIISKYIWDKKLITIKSFFVDNRIVASLKYIEQNQLSKIIIYDFINWKTVNYDGNGNFINKTFLPRPNK